MNWLTSLFGRGAKEVGEGIAAPITAIGNVFDELFTSDDEKAQAAFVLERLRQQPHILQAHINLAQVQHRSLFVAGPRPFIMWICGFALGWHFIGFDLATWITVNWFPHVTAIPVLSGTAELVSVTLALLGLGTMRTIEKAKGLTR